MNLIKTMYNNISWEGSNVPEYLFLENDVHVSEDEDHYGRVVNVLNINIPYFYRCGESREHCIVVGGLWMRGKKKDDVNDSDLTLRESKGDRVLVSYNDTFIHLDNVNVENNGRCGVPNIFATS